MNANQKASTLKAIMLISVALGVVFFVYAMFDTNTTTEPKPIEPYQTEIAVPEVVEEVTIADDRETPEIPGTQRVANRVKQQNEKHTDSKIQVAILLDVSNSMDGLIDQAKAQLWNMVNVMGNARCDGLQPTFELALYEYGRPANGEANGYIKQLHGFTNNLDAVSATLFGIHTNGGSEHCPEVIVKSLDQMQWDAKSSTYKVIFIAGNETFRQGKIPWTMACDKAMEKGVIVNTIYCGSKEMGIREYWNLGAECGKGSYTNINHNAVMDEMDTPYDTLLFSLNDKLNSTYIAYGARGAEASLMQAEMDTKNYTLSKSAAAKRVEVKGKKELYKNDDWDLVDAVAKDKELVNKIDKKDLPENLKNKSPQEISKYLEEQGKQRSEVQKQIAEVSVKRNNYLKSEKEKQLKGTGEVTLESAVEKIIKEQAKRFNMIID
jgi:hypothetical protein